MKYIHISRTSLLAFGKSIVCGRPTIFTFHPEFILKEKRIVVKSIIPKKDIIKIQ